MTLEEMLKAYTRNESGQFNPFATAKLLNSFPHGIRRYQDELISVLQTKITHQDPADLEFYLSIASRDGIDEIYKPILKELVLATWHHCHEDIVDYIRDLKDDEFTDDLYTIAVMPSVYRRCDDDLEATLRKCVHALKAINSNRANGRLEQLKDTGNKNVQFVLDMYN